MEIIIDPSGQARCVYGESLDLTAFGEVEFSRASHVEPDITGLWWADLSPVGGPQLGPFSKRSFALDAETSWLSSHWLMPTGTERKSW